MKRTLFIAGTILLAACSSPSAEKPSEEVKTEAKEKDPTEVRNLLKEYSEYLGSLDSTSEKSVTKAAEKYTALFSGSNEKLCDSSFVFFDRFYRKVCLALNEKIANDKFFSDFSCIWYDTTGVKELPFEKKYVPFRKSIEKNGFRIDCPEGMVEIGENRSFLVPRFYKLVSPVMREFLEGYRKEQDEVFAADAGISISPKAYVDRLVWWEKFNEANPNFIFSKRSKSYQIQLFHFFLTGMDNTPIMDSRFDENGEIVEEAMDDYFVEAYAYLNKKYPNSAVNALVKPYKMALLKKDQAKAERLIRTYTKRGLMIDFEKGYDLDL